MKIGLIDVDGQKIKEINGYDGRYLITENGIVISVYRMSNIHGMLMRVGKPKILKPSVDAHGYLVVNLYKGDGKPVTKKVHRLVAETFLPNPQNKRCVCHIDNNPKNNDVSNLYWGTDKENQEQAWRDGIHKNKTAVFQLDADGNEVHEYESQSSASRETGIPQANIWKCIVGERKSAGGYLWKLA